MKNEIPVQVWRDFQSVDSALKLAAENHIYPILLDQIKRAVNTYNPQWMSFDDREDFVQKEVLHFKTYSLNQFDQATATFSTFVNNNVRNHLNSAFEQRKRIQKNRPTSSLDEPIGEDMCELGDTIPDMFSRDILGELAAESMYEEIMTALQSVNSRYVAILKAWLDTDGNRYKAAKVLAHQGIDLSPYTIYRTMTQIREVVAKLYPETT